MSGEVSAAAFADQGSCPAEADFIVLENFDDNLSCASGRWTVRAPDLAALLGTWTGKLLITSRHPFARAEQPGSIRLVQRHLGPLSRSGAAELTTALPRSACSARPNVIRCTSSRPATRWPWSTWTGCWRAASATPSWPAGSRPRSRARSRRNRSGPGP